HFPSDALQRRLPVLHPPTRQAIERRLGRVRALLDQLDQHPPAIDDYCRHPVAEPLLTTVKHEHGTSIPQRGCNAHPLIRSLSVDRPSVRGPCSTSRDGWSPSLVAAHAPDGRTSRHAT